MPQRRAKHPSDRRAQRAPYDIHHPPTAPATADAELSTSPARRRLKLFGLIIGILLLAAAAWSAIAAKDDISRVLESLSRGPPRRIIALLALPIVNFIFTTLIFWILTRRFGRVTLTEMSALIGAGWLVNYLPLGSGLVGRVAYHRLINNIRIRDSARVVIESTILGLLAALLILAFVLGRRQLGDNGIWLGLGLGILIFGAFALIPSLPGASYNLAFLLKCFDMLIWSYRYAVLFGLAGIPLTAPQAILIATLSQLATMVPFIGNGLGIREWLIGLAAASLPAIAAAPSPTLAGGLSIELVNRTAELAAALAIGVPATFYLAKRIANWQSSSPASPA